MKKLLLILTISILTACSSVDRQVFKARQIFDKYPNEAAKYCGDKFPAADSVLTVRIDSSKGKTIDYTPMLANLENMLDSAKAVVNQKQTAVTDLTGELAFDRIQLMTANKFISNLTLKINNLKAAYKPCGVDTIKRTYALIRINTAKLMALTAQIVTDQKDRDGLQKTLKSEQTLATHRLYYFIGIFLIAVVYLVFKVYKLFSGGGFITEIFK